MISISRSSIPGRRRERHGHGPFQRAAPDGGQFILGAKRADHEALFEWVEATARLNADAVHRFEHNFGHGKKYLATVFAYLMMLAFLLDQVQQRCCTLFQEAQHRAEWARYFREKVRALFLNYQLPDWETLYRALAFGYRRPVPIPLDTS